MLDLETLKLGDKVRVVNNVDNNVQCVLHVNVGDVGIVKKIIANVNKIEVESKDWNRSSVYFLPHQLTILSESEDVIIYKSRWDEIVEMVQGGYGMSDEEAEIVKSVLKNNIPFNVVPDLQVFDPVIEKEVQTHLDANYVGVGGNSYFYYRSDILKEWFYWSDDSEWVDCDYEYTVWREVLPVSFGENK